MKKLLFFLLFISFSLIAQEKKSCYSVEIYKERYSQKNVDKIALEKFEPSCLSMKLRDKLAVRCGCYKDKEELQRNLVRFKKHYKNAKKSITYAYRFNAKSKKQPKKIKPKVKNNSHKECYSIEILRKKDTQENLNILASQEFPISCIQFAKKNSISVSCGCYDEKKEVILSYEKFKKNYENAHIVKIKEGMYKKYLPMKVLIKKVIKKKEIEDTTTVIPFDINISEIQTIKMENNDKQ